ncbi:hypothetical protein [Oceanicella sp. SM1341]|uniref:hypothetical protein n=1 Tax=Oceanicella sp. SM1341 TaxID=1548889 RepID=UPI0013003648|nr:hypothetical protein [Oceanicella sp. SM1341]
MTQEHLQDLELLAAMVRRRRHAQLVSRPGRFEALHAREGDLLLDLSCSALTPEVLSTLLALEEGAGLAGRRRAWLAGETAVDPALEAFPAPALRHPPGQPAEVDGRDISRALEACRHWPETLAGAIRSGEIGGAGGRRFTDVLHLGPEAGDPGPAMVAQSLCHPAAEGPVVHFLSPGEGDRLRRLTARLDPATTAVVFAEREIIAPEMRMLAGRMRGWLLARLGAEGAQRQLFAVTRDVETARAFGLDPGRIVGFTNRSHASFGCWSPVHLGLLIAIGAEALAELRSGAHHMDLHFRDAPAAENLGLLLGLADFWHEDMLGLGQADPLQFGAGPGGWAGYARGMRARRGAPPAQGRARVADLLVSALPEEQGWDDYQVAAMAEGLHSLRLRTHGGRARGPGGPKLIEPRRGEGAPAPGQPTVTLAYGRFDAFTLGRLMALTEHRLFVTASLRGRSFRAEPRRAQGEVARLGRVLCGGSATGTDPALRGLLSHLMHLRGVAPAASSLAGHGAEVISFPGLSGRRRGGAQQRPHRTG